MAQVDSNSLGTSEVTAADVLGSEKTPDAAAPDTQTPEDRISPKLQLLLRREKTAIERERTAKAKEADLAERERRLEEFEQIKKTNPRKALELLGLSYQDLTAIEMNDGQIPADLHVKRLDERITSLVRSQEEAQRMEEENAKKLAERQEAEATEKFKSEISQYLKENPDRYELISFDQKEDLIYETIDEHYSRTMNPETGVGEVLTIAQAADKVELYLEKKYEKAPTSKKLQAFLTRRTGNPVDKPQNETGQKLKTPQTNLQASPTPQRRGPITDDDRVARALAYFRSMRP